MMRILLNVAGEIFYADCVIEETKCTGEIIEGDSIFALEGMLDWKYFKSIACNKLYKKSVIGDIRYPVGKLHEDEFTTYKYFHKAKKLVYVDVSKYNYYRGREESITGGTFKENNLLKCEALRERIDFFREHKIDSLEEKMNNVYCWVLLDSMNKCYQHKINGNVFNQIYRQAVKDIDYLKTRPVNNNYIKELTILSQGLR